MKLKNDILELEVENKGGEMCSIIYKGINILYDGKGPYWSDKNPTLFPIINSPKSKEYVLNGITYPIKNHGLIRYSILDTLISNENKIVLELNADEETLKHYPYRFHYQIEYQLDKNKVIISYKIKNTDNKIMPFTFGIHPGFICDVNKDYVYFSEDKQGEILTNFKTRESQAKKLDKYFLNDFCDDIEKYETVEFKPLKTKKIKLVRNDYKVIVDGSSFKYLAMWTPDRRANFLCIEPWCSMDDIEDAINPFDDSKYELMHLNPEEEFNISYSIEVE